MLYLRYSLWGNPMGEDKIFTLTWSWWPDLNRRPADYESAALPTEPHQHAGQQ